MVVRCRDYIALYFFVVIAVSTIEVAIAQEQLGSPSDQADHDLGASVAVGSGDLKRCASTESGCSVPDVLKFAEAQLHHCAPLFTAKAQVVLAKDHKMLGEGGRSKLQKGGTTASSKGPLNPEEYKYEALDLGEWMKLHSQKAILEKEADQHTKIMIKGFKVGFKFTTSPSELKKIFQNMNQIDANLDKVKHTFKTGVILNKIQAWSQSVVFVSSKAATEKAKIIAAAYDAKARAKARKASAAGTHFRRAAVHGPKDEQHESRQRAQHTVAKSGRRQWRHRSKARGRRQWQHRSKARGRRQWRHRSKARSRSASKNQGKISCVTPHDTIADCSKDPAAVKAALKLVIKAGHKVDKMLGSSDGCETKHGDVADCSQAVARLKGRRISQQLGKGFNVKRLRRKGKKKGKKKKGKKKAKPAAATTSASTSNDLFASCRSMCAHSYKPQTGMVRKIQTAKATQGQPASKKKNGLRQLGEDLDGDEDDLSRSRMNSRGRRKADELMLGEGTKKKKKDPFKGVKLPVTEESLTKQCNDGSLTKLAMRDSLCSDDRSRGFGSSGCVQCQNQLCVKTNGPDRCWRCSLLHEGSSLGFSCFRIAGAESTVCKSLITDEATQPWIGCRTKKASAVPGSNFICRGRSKKKELGEGKMLTTTVGSTMTSPFPLFKEVQCTKAHGMQRCGVRKVNPCTHKDKKRSNMCKMGEGQISLTKAF